MTNLFGNFSTQAHGLPGSVAIYGAMTMDASFPPSHRLHTNGDFSRVFNRQQKAAGRHVVFLVMPRSRRAGPRARLGVMIPNKTVKTSVRRHLLKRWVREWFRRNGKEVLAGHDVVVLFRSNPPDDSHALLDKELTELMPKALAASTGPGNGRRPSPRAPQPRPTTNVPSPASSIDSPTTP